MKETKILRKNPGMVTRKIQNEIILLPIYKTSDEIECLYTLNKVASQVWSLIDGKRTVAEIKKDMSKKVSSTEKELDKEMSKFLKELKEINAIV